MALLLLLLLSVVLIAMLPRWSYSRGWGYFPSGLVGVVLLMLVIILVLRSLLGGAP